MPHILQCFGEAMGGSDYAIRHLSYKSGITIEFLMNIAAKSPYPDLEEWERIIGTAPVVKSSATFKNKYAEDVTTYRLLWLARLFTKARQSFPGDVRAFRSWFEKPNPHFNGFSPREAIASRMRDIPSVCKSMPIQ